MSEFHELKTRIQDLLTRHREGRERQRLEIEARMEDLERRERRFRELALHIFRDLIEPRLRLLAESFPDAACAPSPEGDHGTVTFNRELRFAASVSLRMGVVLEKGEDKASVVSRLRIIPVLFEYQAEDSLPFPLEAPDDGRIARWVEEQLVQCVECYLRVQEEPGYHQENLVVDPVCGMTINLLEAAASAEHGGKTYHFCVASCKERFLANPEKYLMS